MKKPSKFKKMKNEAAQFLVEELSKGDFNRFTEHEIIAVAGYYPNVDKPFLEELLKFRLLKCLSIKLNFDYFIVDIKIDRKRVYEPGGGMSRIDNEVITRVSPTSKRIENTVIYSLEVPHYVPDPVKVSSEKKTKTRHKFYELLELRTSLIKEIEKITRIHNELCKIFKDVYNKYPSILSAPEFGLSGEEIQEICG